MGPTNSDIDGANGKGASAGKSLASATLDAIDTDANATGNDASETQHVVEPIDKRTNGRGRGKRGKDKHKRSTWNAERRADASERAKQRWREREEFTDPPPRVEPVSYPTSAAASGEAEKKIHQNLADLTGVLLTVHSVLAALTRIQELELEEEEARKLANASKEVLKHYPLGLSDKNLAWVNLAVVACGIYGTRLMAFSMRKAAEKRARIVTLPGGPMGPAEAPHGPTVSAKPNGVPNIRLDDLTPAWMSIPPENEVIP